MFALFIFIVFVTVDFYLVVFWPTWHRRAWRRRAAVRRGGMIALAVLEGAFWVLINCSLIRLENWGCMVSLEFTFIALMLGLIMFLIFAESRLRDHPSFQHLWHYPN